MNVGVFITDYTPEAGGGYTFQVEILNALTKLAKDCRHNFVAFAYSNGKSNIDNILESGELRLIYYNPPSPNLIDPLMTKIYEHIPQLETILKKPKKLYLEQIAKEVGIDIIWFLGPSSMQVDLPNIRIVWDLQHRLQPWFQEVSANGIWYDREKFYLISLQRATFVIAGTKSGRKEIEQFYQVPTEHIKILPHPTPNYALHATLNDHKDVLGTYGIPGKYLFYPAQFWSHKNHANLLIATRILRDKYELTLPVVFVGSDKGNLNYIKRLVMEFNLSSQVRFLGFVPQADLILLYKNAFALAYVSFFGPENLPPLEAFALGCPVVASNVPGAEEQLGDAALLVDPKSPENIASAIKSLYDDAELQKILVRRGFERASKWTAEDFVRGIFKILDEFESVRRCWE